MTETKEVSAAPALSPSLSAYRSISGSPYRSIAASCPRPALSTSLTRGFAGDEVKGEINDEFVGKKQKICTLIYQLLQSICTNNQKNQETASKYLPLFAVQSKYIPGAMECIVSIIQNYEELLLTLYKEEQEEQPQMQPDKAFSLQHHHKGKARNQPIKKLKKYDNNLARQKKNIEKEYTQKYDQMVLTLVKTNYQ